MGKYNRRIKTSHFQYRSKSQLDKQGLVNNSQNSTQYSFKGGPGDVTPFSKKNAVENKALFYSSNPDYKTITESNNENSPEKTEGPMRSQAQMINPVESKMSTFQLSEISPQQITPYT